MVGGSGLIAEGDPGQAWWTTVADGLGALEPGQKISDFYAQFTPLSEEWRQMMDVNDPAALAAMARGMVKLTVDPSDLAANEVPILLLIGENDWDRPQADAALAVGANVEMHVLPGRNHLDAFDDPNYIPVIRAFLRR